MRKASGRYQIYLLNKAGQEFSVFSTDNVERARDFATGVQARRQVKIYRDGGLLKGGRNALDDEVYRLRQKLE